jgi:hypothetical protein
MHEAHPTEHEELNEGLDVGEPAWVGEPISVSEGQAATPVQLGDEVVPPDRVRFSAPVVVHIPGEAEPCDGVIVNLSDAGLACVLPLELDDGERISCRFRPALGEDHLTVEAEVVWRRDAGDADVLYGLRLLDLSPDIAERLHDVVRERSEGRAGAWPLPLVPTDKAGPSPYMMAVVGMALGAVLSLGISFLPDVVFGSGGKAADTLAEPVSPGAQVVTLTEKPRPLSLDGTSTAAPSPATAPAQDDAEHAGRFAAPTPAPAPAAEPKPVVEAKPAVEARPLVRPEPAVEAKPVVEAKPAVAPAHAAEARPEVVKARHPGRGHSLEQHQAARAAELTLFADHNPTGVKTFWMDSPRRLVVDALGAHSAMDASEYRMAGPLATRVRVGVHPDRVRFVIETLPGVSADVKAKGSAVSVQLSRK